MSTRLPDESGLASVRQRLLRARPGDEEAVRCIPGRHPEGHREGACLGDLLVPHDAMGRRSHLGSSSVHRFTIASTLSLADGGIEEAVVRGESEHLAEAAANRMRDGRAAVAPDAAYLVPLEAPTTTSALIP